jgi:chemotaxis protein MotB
MTFADLMSLLMCFFVLLLSFSEMDVSKYKEMAGSLKNAFGVQREINVKEPPKGINVIAREFSPGLPEPTHMNVIRQMTTNDMRINLDLGRRRYKPVATPREQDKIEQKEQASNEKARSRPAQDDGLSESQKRELEKAKQLAAVRLEQKLEAERQLASLQAQQKDGGKIDEKSLEELVAARQAAEKRRKLEQSARLISNALGKEIKAGSVDVETEGQKIIIRVREKASFGSGSAELKGAFRPLLARVAKILKGSEGKIIVAGHTDNVPIYTERFRSNWELSSARAVSVAHEMMLATDIPSNRFLIQGFADTDPIAGNDSAANRAKNRRVEIILLQGEDRQATDRQISAGDPLAAGPAVTPAARGATPPAGTRQTAPATPGTGKAATRGDGASTAKPAGIKVGGAASGAAARPPSAKPAAQPSGSLGIKAAGSR